MLPTPAIGYVPQALVDNLDVGGAALVAFLDAEMARYKVGIGQLLDLYSVDKTQYIDELGYLLAAGIIPGESDRVKRAKVLSAIERHRNRGSWELAVKPTIDGITGLDASIWPSTTLDDFILWGKTIYDADDITGVLGAKTDYDEGVVWVGATNEPQVKGNVYIDLGGDAVNPDAATIATLVSVLTTNIAPAYFQIFLGYLSGGQFIRYAGGDIV